MIEKIFLQIGKKAMFPERWKVRKTWPGIRNDRTESCTVFSIIAPQIIDISLRSSHRRIQSGNQSHLIAHMKGAIYACDAPRLAVLQHARIHHVLLNFWFWPCRIGGMGPGGGKTPSKLIFEGFWNITTFYLVIK